MELQNSHRYEWVDVAKGISMLLIIWGHTYFYGDTYKYTSWINFFHVPIWVFLSFLFVKNETWLKSLKNKGKRLMKPYYIWGFVTSVVCMESLSGWKHYIIGERACGAMWFLPLLFSILVLHKTVKMCGKYKLFVSLGGPVLVLLLFNGGGKSLPFNVDVALFILPFALVAETYKEQVKANSTNVYTSILCILGIAMTCIISNMYDLSLIPNFYESEYGCLPLTLFLGFCGIYIICFYSKKLSDYVSVISKAVSFVGKNSMVFLIFHQRLIVDPIYKLGKTIGINFSEYGIISNILVFFCAIIICTILCKFFENKYLKWTIV